MRFRDGVFMRHGGHRYKGFPRREARRCICALSHVTRSSRAARVWQHAHRSQVQLAPFSAPSKLVLRLRKPSLQQQLRVYILLVDARTALLWLRTRCRSQAPGELGLRLQATLTVPSARALWQTSRLTGGDTSLRTGVR
jgi:hypothetical protein